MKILYAIRSVVSYSTVEPIIRHLCANGHSVVALFDPVWSYERPDYAIQNSLANTPGLTRGWSIKRQDQWLRFLPNSRELLSYSSYLIRREQSEFYLRRQEGYLYPPVQWVVRRSKLARSLIATELIQSLLRTFERIAPPDGKISRWLKNNQPDVVVAAPANMRFSPEVEYVKAARALGIPTVIPVFSWDNLTTKGLYHIIPDLLLAWNQTQVNEATRIHRVPRDRIVITGAPVFDRWLKVDPLGMTRQAFCRKVGLDVTHPFVVYLGSSENIATDEAWLVRELVQCLQRHPNPEIRKINVLIRPHPGHAEHYECLKEEVAIWPHGGALPDSEESLQDFYNTLRYCVGTVGINNSAMLEAIINDKPCVTIVTERYKTTQMQAGHFQHLLDFDVLEVTGSARECADILERLCQGQDSTKQARHRFVRDFIRPRGLERPAGEVAARAIVLAAARKNAAQIDQEIGSADGF